MKTIKSDVRWILRRDMPVVLDIEKRSFSDPWTEEEFIGFLREPGGIGNVIEHDDQIVGYILFDLMPGRIYVANMAVDPKYRRMGLGSKLIDKIKRKLTDVGRNRISTHVNERNLGAQLFLREHGFRCERIEKGMYDKSDLDAYLMVYWLDQQKSP